MGNLLIAHGGAPTAVINASLYGVIKKLREKKFAGRVLAARYGAKGILEEDFIDITDVSDAKLELLKYTPGSSIGTSRHPLYEEEYGKMKDIFAHHNIEYVLFNGGNGSMDTCGNIVKYCPDVIAMGIPKTIDNDIMITDHAPGYASAARYVAKVTAEAMQDLRGLPIHVSVLESMGRNTGWISAAASLSGMNGDAPHLICLPEIPFDENKFLTKAEELYKEYGGVLIVASEGLKKVNGEPIVEPIFKTERAVYFGDVSSHLANLVVKNLGIKARSEKPGLLGRCAMAYASKIDIEEAVVCGEVAAESALDGISGKMVGLKRLSTTPYMVEPFLIPIEDVMMKERLFPTEYMGEDGLSITQEFRDWCKPLVGELDEFVSFL